MSESTGQGALVKLVGPKVANVLKEEVTVASLQGEGKVLGLYFSAHWCPPCRAFTPQLAEWYKKVKDGPNGAKFEIVFVSSDRDEKSFDDYHGEMPWLALPYEEREKKTELSRKFKVTGIPTLVFVDACNGELITGEGRSVVLEDANGEQFPWRPKPFTETISCGPFINRGSKEDKKEYAWANDLKGKILGIYFSAHWCGPCRAFTPQLVKTYQKLKEEGKNFEIVFVSSDRDKDAMLDYLNEMPWLAIPFGDSRKKSLSQLFSVSGIPTLIIIDENGKVITPKGRSVVAVDPEGKEFPWYPKPLQELRGETADTINDCPSVIWFTDGEEASIENAKRVFEPIATKWCDKWKADGVNPEINFFYAGGVDDADDIVDSLRNFASLPAKLPLLVMINIPNQVTSYLSEPVCASSKPESASSEPVCASSEPQAASSEPESASSEPKAASSEPKAASSEPKSASSEAESAASKFEITEAVLTKFIQDHVDKKLDTRPLR